MNPGRIITRTDLVMAVRALSPSKACMHAIDEGRVCVLGGFSVIPPFDLSGWICSVRSRHGRTWHLALLVDEVKHKYILQQIEEIPWRFWKGRVQHDEPWSPYNGDDPDLGGNNFGCDGGVCGNMGLERLPRQDE